MTTSPKRYRLRLSTSVPPQFGNWFPNLAAHTDDDGETFIVEGPVVDSCQLAGIVSAICHRNGEILSVEQMDSGSEAPH